jgi:hypothetical protein
MVVHHLKHARRNAQHATTQLSLARLGIFILFLTAIVFFYPIGAKADDLDQKIERIVKNFEQQIGVTKSGSEYFVVVRSFFDGHARQSSKRSEKVTESIFINFRDRYFDKSNIVILNWVSVKPLEIKASNADEIFYRQGIWEQKLVENFGTGFLVTGTTVTADELVEIHAQLIDMTTGKMLASSKETLVRGPDDVAAQEAPQIIPAGDGEVTQAQSAPLTAVAATPPSQEMPSEKIAVSDVLKTEMPLKEKLKDLQYKVIEGINSRYEGYVKNGKKHGQGTLAFKNGDKYVGQWHADKKHGQGTYFFKNGDKWEGSYVNNKKHGRGVYTWTSGKSQEEVWENGKLAK